MGDVEVRADATLRGPIAAYFSELRSLLVAALGEAAEARALTDQTEPHELAATIMAVVQGAYVLAQGSGEREAYDAAIAGALALVAAAEAAP